MNVDDTNREKRLFGTSILCKQYLSLVSNCSALARASASAACSATRAGERDLQDMHLSKILEEI